MVYVRAYLSCIWLASLASGRSLCSYMSPDIACNGLGPVVFSTDVTKHLYTQKLAIPKHHFKDNKTCSAESNHIIYSLLKKRCQSISAEYNPLEFVYHNSLNEEPEPFASVEVSFKTIQENENISLNICDFNIANKSILEKQLEEIYSFNINFLPKGSKDDHLILFKKSKCTLMDEIVVLETTVVTTQKAHIAKLYKIAHRGFFSSDKKTFSRILFNDTITVLRNGIVHAVQDCKTFQNVFFDSTLLKICQMPIGVAEGEGCTPIKSIVYKEPQCVLQTIRVPDSKRFFDLKKISPGCWTVATTSTQISATNIATYTTQIFNISSSGIFDIIIPKIYQVNINKILEGDPLNSNNNISISNMEQLQHTSLHQLNGLTTNARPSIITVIPEYDAQTNTLINTYIKTPDYLTLLPKHILLRYPIVVIFTSVAMSILCLMGCVCPK